jgi:hypothetical protein
MSDASVIEMAGAREKSGAASVCEHCTAPHSGDGAHCWQCGAPGAATPKQHAPASAHAAKTSDEETPTALTSSMPTNGPPANVMGRAAPQGIQGASAADESPKHSAGRSGTPATIPQPRTPPPARAGAGGGCRESKKEWTAGHLMVGLLGCVAVAALGWAIWRGHNRSPKRS